MNRIFKKETTELILAGLSLAFLAGYVNVYMLRFFENPVSHLTGAFSMLPIYASKHDSHHLIGLSLIIPGFFLGAVLSSYIINQNYFVVGKRYGVILILEGLLLIITEILVVKHLFYALFTAAMSCGMQNAMASLYRGMIIRTTHVTGLITDFGILIGRLLRGQHIDKWKFQFDFALIFGFLFGGIVCSLLSEMLLKNGLLFPATICIGAGLIYFLWRTKRMEKTLQKRNLQHH